MGWIIDFCAQALREIIIGMGGKSDGFMMKSGFAIAVSSEIMAILAVATDLKDMRERMGRIVVAYSKDGKPVTTHDLGCDGAMTAWMVEAINPNLLQTIEGQPVLRARRAVRQHRHRPVLHHRRPRGAEARRLHVTESGFAADIGFEKFWNLKCRIQRPQAPLLRWSLPRSARSRCTAAGPSRCPGKPLPKAYKGENVGWVEKGCENLVHHIKTVKKAGINPVVCINAFYTDTDDEIKAVRRLAEAAGARVALSRALGKGRRRRAGARRRGHGRLQREERVQVPLRAFTPLRSASS